MSEPRFRIKVDGTFVFKGTLGDWERKPPNEFKNAIKPGAAPKPWMKGVMVALSDAVMERRSMDFVVTTRHKGWTLEVDERDLP